MGAPQYEQAGADIGGSGTTNTIPRWTGASTLGDSLLTQSGTTVIGSSMTGFGIGTTVSPWGAGRYALQVGGSPTSNIVGGSPNTVFGSNQYHDGTDARYINNGFAATYVQSAGEHRWSTAASGTAGAVATLTQYMVINSSGNVGIGTASPTNNGAGTQTLMVNGSTTGVYDLGVNGGRQGSWFYSGGSVNIGSVGNVSFALMQNATIRWYINTSGHFIANVDNTYDIGASGATRPRTVYAGTGVVGGYLRAGAASAGAASTTTIGNGTSTTATAGAETLPANPLGFIIAHVGTTEVRIPYYAV